jgi:hypothetical protein
MGICAFDPHGHLFQPIEDAKILKKPLATFFEKQIFEKQKPALVISHLCLGTANYQTKIEMLCADLKIINGGCLNVIVIICK